MLRLRLVLVGYVVRSLGSGGGNTLTRGLNEVLPAVRGKYMQKKIVYKRSNKIVFGPLKISGEVRLEGFVRPVCPRTIFDTVYHITQ